jgi:hypothetical protein
MSDLKFHLQGSQTDATAAALEMFFAETFCETARRENLPMPAPGETQKVVDPIAVAGLVLSIPGALLAAMDLAQRLQLKEKVERLIALARREWREHGTRIWLQRRNATPLALDEIEPADVLDAADKARQL